MKKELVHKIVNPYNREEIFIYHPNTHTLFKADTIVAEILDEYINGNQWFPRIIARYNVKIEEINEVINKFNEYIAKAKTFLSDRDKAFEKWRDSIEVKVNVSHVCNLRCIYCYGVEGTYGLKGKMNKHVAVSTVIFFENYFSNANIRFTFFGGEPLLNLFAISTLCETATKLISKNNNIYSFGIITNGTILNGDILELIKKYNISVTISIDGPKEIHNYLRKFCNGQGTYDTVVFNLREIKKKCEIPIYYETTFTSIHEEKGMMRRDCVRFLMDKLNFQGGVITNVNPPTKNTEFLEPRNYTIEECLNNLQDGRLDDWAYFPFRYFVNKIFPKYICGIGITHFVVVPNGDIYPCQLFVGDRNFVLGNVLNPGYLTEKNKRAFSLLEIINKEKNARCQDCWAIYLCKGCPGNAYKRTGLLFFNETECERIRKNYEKLLTKLAEIRLDESKYQRLIAIIKERDRQLELV